MIAILLKTKVKANFKFNVNEETDFTNNLLSWMPELADFLLTIPSK